MAEGYTGSLWNKLRNTRQRLGAVWHIVEGATKITGEWFWLGLLAALIRTLTIRQAISSIVAENRVTASYRRNNAKRWVKMASEEHSVWLRRVIEDSPGDYYRRPIRINGQHPDWTKAEVLLIGEKPATPWRKDEHTVEEIMAPVDTGTKTGGQIGHFLNRLASYNAQVTNVCIYSGSLSELTPVERRREIEAGRRFVTDLIEITHPTLKAIFFHGRKAIKECAWRYFKDENGHAIKADDLSIHTALKFQPLYGYYRRGGNRIALFACGHFSGNHTPKTTADIEADIDSITNKIVCEIKQLQRAAQTLNDLFRQAGF